MAKKKGKVKHPVKQFFTIFILIISTFLTYVSIKEVVTTVQLSKDLKQSQNEIKKLKETQAQLQEQKEKFQNPDYVKYYARGKYLLSKEGETIYKFQPDVENEKK